MIIALGRLSTVIHFIPISVLLSPLVYPSFPISSAFKIYLQFCSPFFCLSLLFLPSLLFTFFLLRLSLSFSTLFAPFPSLSTISTFYPFSLAYSRYLLFPSFTFYHLSPSVSFLPILLPLFLIPFFPSFSSFLHLPPLFSIFFHIYQRFPSFSLSPLYSVFFHLILLSPQPSVFFHFFMYGSLFLCTLSTLVCLSPTLFYLRFLCYS